MHNNDDLIIPMEYYGPGACPNCFSTLVLADQETNIMDLDKNGNVVSISDTIVKCKAMCPRCGFSTNMMRSNGIYRPYSETIKILDDLDIEIEKAQRRNKGRYSIKNNPLSK